MGTQRRILVLTADAGFGHRSAANAVVAALRETHGDECTVEVANPLDDKRTPPILRSSQLDYDRMVRELPDLYEFGYQASDASAPTSIANSRTLAVGTTQRSTPLLNQIRWTVTRSVTTEISGTDCRVIVKTALSGAW